MRSWGSSAIMQIWKLDEHRKILVTQRVFLTSGNPSSHNFLFFHFTTIYYNANTLGISEFVLVKNRRKLYFQQFKLLFPEICSEKVTGDKAEKALQENWANNLIRRERVRASISVKWRLRECVFELEVAAGLSSAKGKFAPACRSPLRELSYAALPLSLSLSLCLLALPVVFRGVECRRNFGSEMRRGIANTKRAS